MLSDRYLHGIPDDSRIAHDGRFLHQSQLDEKITQIRALNDLAQARGQSLAQMALAWLLHDDAVTTVLVGASKPEQILNDLTAIDNTDFTQEELQRINEITGA